MKKWVIGSLVGAIIVFVWQAASWMFLGIHAGEMKYTPAQDQVLATLASSNLEDGMYMLPNAKPGTSMEEHENMRKQMEGKPWAWVLYSNKMNIGMTGPMIIGFVVDLILVVLLISILVRGGLPSFIGIFSGAISVGIFTFLWGPYMERNWYNVPWSAIIGHLYDAIIAWALCGLWLAWWLRRPVSP